MKQLFLAPVLLPFLAGLVSCHSGGSVKESSPKFVHVEGHRGARWVRPENTLPAFEYALSIGVDVLELDLAVTADKRVVVAHDPFINPEHCLDAKGRKVKPGVLIKDLTLKQVKSYDCGTPPNSRFPEQKRMKAQIPTLEEVFDLVNLSTLTAAKTVGFNIETKVFPEHPEATWDVNTFVDAVLAVFKKYSFHDRIVVQSFDFRTLRRIRQLDPTLKLSALTDENVHPLKILGDLKVEVLSPYFESIDADIVREAHRRGMKVVPWTVNRRAEFERMLAIGVDGMISDHPELCLSYLREKGVHP